ncbi:hypothetical protein [Szabonella alba]|uniref:hypothetical protein n=1 Tax=Szabonella alba TaxID=2804194 RepID=UPI003080652B
MRTARHFGGLFAFQRNRQNAREITPHLDLQLSAHRVWRQDYLLHQRAQNVSGTHAPCLGILLQGRVELFDLLAVVMGHVRVKQGRGLIRFDDLCLQLLLPVLQILHLLHHPRGRIVTAGGHDELHQLIEFPVDLPDLGLCRVD